MLRRVVGAVGGFFLWFGLGFEGLGWGRGGIEGDKWDAEMGDEMRGLKGPG